MKRLHPLQVKILKLLNEKELTIYKIGQTLKEQADLVRYHVLYLFDSKILKRVKNPDGRGFVYMVDREVVDFKKKKKIEYIVIESTLRLS